VPVTNLSWRAGIALLLCELRQAQTPSPLSNTAWYALGANPLSPPSPPRPLLPAVVSERTAGSVDAGSGRPEPSRARAEPGPARPGPTYQSWLGGEACGMGRRGLQGAGQKWQREESGAPDSDGARRFRQIRQNVTSTTGPGPTYRAGQKRQREESGAASAWRRSTVISFKFPRSRSGALSSTTIRIPGLRLGRRGTGSVTAASRLGHGVTAGSRRP
jgi:hypothetical protein